MGGRDPYHEGAAVGRTSGRHPDQALMSAAGLTKTLMDWWRDQNGAFRTDLTQEEMQRALDDILGAPMS